MSEDPRTNEPHDPNDVLTEDSDDALADLEKEYAVKRQKLLEERARKKEKPETPVQVERSPSPERRVPFTSKQFPPAKQELHDAVVKTANPRPGRDRPPQRILVPSNVFASRLYNAESTETKDVNYKDRLFEFEKVPAREIVTEDCIDDISGELLSRRYISQQDLMQLLSKIKILRVTKLLAKVYPPKFEEPQYMNWCFTGIILHKSDPKISVNKQKFMALRVGNFLHTIDVYLFGDAFTRFWKLRCGDVIAVLNPTVKKYGSGFNLSVLDDLNNILEIGTLKYFGHCSATTKAGEKCKYVVDLLKNELCSFHEESRFKHGSRMELQGSVKPKAPLNKQGLSGQAYVSSNSNQTMFVQYANSGFQEKDIVYSGGQQFDQAKYDRPVEESSYSKLKKKRANEKLRSVLVKTSAPARLDDLEKLGIVQKNDTERKERQSSLQTLRKQAFKGSFLNGMGYDPTQERMKNVEKMKASKSLEELRALGKSKRVSLHASQEERSKKQRKWKEAFNITNPNGVTARNNLLRPAVAKSAGQHKRCNPKIPNLDANGGPCEKEPQCAGEYESDLEISFACDADESQYKKAIAASPK